MSEGPVVDDDGGGEPGEAYVRVRCYTAHRKMQSFIGQLPGGGKLPMGIVLTILQAAVLGVGVFLMFKTMSIWGPVVAGFGPLGYLGGLVGLPGGAAVALRKPKVGGRWVWQAARGFLALWAHQVRDRGEGRRGGRGYRPGRAVWVAEWAEVSAE